MTTAHASLQPCIFFTVIAALACWGCAADDIGGPMSPGAGTTDDAVADTTGSSDEGGEPPDDEDTDGGPSNDVTTGNDTNADSGTEPAPSGVCFGIDIVGDLGWVFGGTSDSLSTDATCGAKAMPCGGDPVGVWSGGTQCGYEQLPNPLEEDCSGSTFSVSTSQQSGGIDIAADGTFTWDTSTTSVWRFSFDAMACFGETCAEVQSGFAEDDPEATCTTDGDLCACDFGEVEAVTMSGTWQTEGQRIVLEIDGDGDEYQFCVGENRLDLWQPLESWTQSDTTCNTDNDCEATLGAEHEEVLCDDPNEEEEE